MSEERPGLDPARLEAWLRGVLPDAPAGELTASLITGGRSNLTYRIGLGPARWILRRPPVGEVQATAHDMGREFRVMTALADTPVPVPRTIVECEDASVLGAPFYVMEEADGTPYRRAEQLEPLGPARTRAISERLVDVLVRLHQVDHRERGLESFGRPEGFLARQVQRWSRQLAASRTRDLPDADRLAQLLTERLPGGGPVGIVHGDYRLDNVLVDDDDLPTAVIDWEMATVADTLTDLALMLVYKRLGHELGGEAVTDASSASGFLTEDEILDRYATGRGVDLADFGFYVGLASFKLAGILEGVHYRYLHGQTVGPGFEQVGAAVQPLLAAGLNAVKEHA